MAAPDQHRTEDIALALLKHQYERVDPKKALGLCQELVTTLVGIGIPQEEAVAFADGILGDKIRAAFVVEEKKGAAGKTSETPDDLADKLDQLLRIGGEIIDRLFPGKPGKSGK